MKIQLLLRRVDPLGAGSDDPAAERTHESATLAIVDGALDTVARSAAAATAGPVYYRSSPTAAATAAA